MAEPSLPRCYLDYNAAAPLRPEVGAAVAEALTLTGNPSSVHGFGRECRASLEAARRAVAALVRVAPGQVIFTSGGTEANALALSGTPAVTQLVTAIEHESVLGAAPSALRLPVDHLGLADLTVLERLLGQLPAPVLLSIMLANNETGVIQPVAAAARLVHRYGGLCHCDAVQAAGRLPLDFSELGVDLLSLSAHKLGGPAGVGALVVGPALTLTPLIRGGGQERRRRAGTENRLGIVGFGRAAALAADDLACQPRFTAWRDRLEREAQVLAPALVVVGQGAPRVATTSCLALPGVSAEALVIAFDLAGVAVSAGAACASGSTRPSHVLEAMALPASLAGGAIRVSFGWATTEAELDRFLEVWGSVVRRRWGVSP